MPKYEVEFGYSIPYWGDIELTATDKQEAEVEAEYHISQTYPEAIDVEITSVKELDG